jgi:hypothetical protein
MFICGTMMVVVGIAGSLVAMSMVAKWWYASIPAVIGLLLCGCGGIAQKLRKAQAITLPIALLIAVLGVVGSFMPSGLNFSAPGSVAFISSIFRLLTIAICTGFIAVSVRGSLTSRASSSELP